MRIIQLSFLVVCSTVIFTGCATSGRHVLLKEYNPTVPPKADSLLKGATVSIKAFGDAFNINNNLEDNVGSKTTEEPQGYSYIKMTPEQEKAWNRDVEARKRSSSEKDWKAIGYVRNGFGMVMSKVYAINSPVEWLTDTLKMDLQQQGAQVVDTSQAGTATVSIEGTIRYFKIDIYMAYWADLIVDVQIRVKDKPPINRTIHTRAGQTAWSTSSFEYYQSMRQCQQKLSRIVLAEIEKELKN